VDPVLTPLPAATVLFLRDAPAPAGGLQLEVLMLRRNDQSGFVRSAYLFPGGAVDPEDADPALAARCRGRHEPAATTLLGRGVQDGLAHWVAALRESFEEAGLLVADPPPPAEARVEARAQMEAGTRSFADLCARFDLELATDRVHPYSHWITPAGAPRRYDTRFFVALAPEGQEASADQVETVAHLWITPQDALARHRAGGFELIFPTMRSLLDLQRFRTAEEVLEVARSAEAQAADGPAGWVEDHEGWRIPLPDHPSFDDPAPVRRGPREVTT